MLSVKHMSCVSILRNRLLALMEPQADSLRISHKNETISVFPSCTCCVLSVAVLQAAKFYPWENSCFVHQRTGIGNQNSVLTLCCQCGYGRHLTRVIYCLTYSISYSQLGNYTSLSIISESGAGVVIVQKSDWIMCKKDSTLIPTVKHRTNILIKPCGLTFCTSGVVSPFSEQTLFPDLAATVPLAVNVHTSLCVKN